MSNPKPINMRQFMTVLAAFVCVVAIAQKKPNITKAKTLYDKGEYAEAKAIIDQATTYEKTMGKAKTWYYRGMIYVSLDTAMSEPGAMVTAMESFNKALEIDPEQKSISEFTGLGVENVDTKIQAYYGYYYNTALEFYNGEDYNKAADNFENAYYIMPSDTNAMINAATSAGLVDDTERAKKNYTKALDAGMKDKNTFLRLYNYAVADEDLEEALLVLKRAKTIHPDDQDLQKYEIGVLSGLGRIDDAKQGIIDAIEKDPNSADLHYNLGIIHEQSGDVESARDSYRAAVKIDDSHYNSNFNLGVLAFNETQELIKERNALSYKETEKNKELTEKINSGLEEALPYWEKLYEMNGKDETVLETLSYIYTSLRMNDKAEKMADELDALKG